MENTKDLKSFPVSQEDYLFELAFVNIAFHTFLKK